MQARTNITPAANLVCSSRRFTQLAKSQRLTQLQIRSSCLTGATMFEVVRGIPHVSLMPVHSYEVEMIYLLIDPITERTQSSINNTQHPVAHSTRHHLWFDTIVARFPLFQTCSFQGEFAFLDMFCHSTRPFLQNTTSGLQHEWLHTFRDLKNVARGLARLCYCLLFLLRTKAHTKDDKRPRSKTSFPFSYPVDGIISSKFWSGFLSVHEKMLFFRSHNSMLNLSVVRY